MSGIKAELKEATGIKQQIEIEVPVDRIATVFERVFKKVGKDVKLKGFRKGKVPKHIIDQYHGEDVEKEVMEEVVRETYPEAITNANAEPISAPHIEPGAFDKDKPFTYVATFEIRPVVELKGYDGLKLEKPEISVEKEEVENQLKMIQQQMTQLEPTDDDAKVEVGMVLMVDFKGSADGQPFNGSEAKDFHVDFGAGSMLPQFEEALSGMKKGEEKDFEFDYPADYFNNDLAGKKGKFNIKVKDIKKKNVPELNDEFAKTLGDFKNLGEIKKDIEKRMLEQKEMEVKRIISSQVMEQLVESHDFEVPESMINSELQAMFESYIKYLNSQGKKFEDTGTTVDQFIEQYKKDATNRVKSFLVIDAISEVEKIEVTDEDVEARLALIAQQSGQPLPRIKQQYEKDNLIASLKIQLTHEKTVDLVIDKAKIKVKKAKKEKKDSKKAK